MAIQNTGSFYLIAPLSTTASSESPTSSSAFNQQKCWEWGKSCGRFVARPGNGVQHFQEHSIDQIDLLPHGGSMQVQGPGPPTWPAWGISVLFEDRCRNGLEKACIFNAPLAWIHLNILYSCLNKNQTPCDQGNVLQPLAQKGMKSAVCHKGHCWGSLLSIWHVTLPPERFWPSLGCRAVP